MDRKIAKIRLRGYGGIGIMMYETQVTYENGDRETMYIPVRYFKNLGIVQRINGVSQKVEKWLNTAEGKNFVAEHTEEFIKNRATLLYV